MEILDIKRGDIVLININYDVDTETFISRPFLVVQNNIGNKYLNTVITIPIIERIPKAKVPTHVKLPREVTGLENDSIAVTELIKTYSKKMIKVKIGELNENSEYMIRVEKAMHISTGQLVLKSEESEFDYQSYVEELTKPLIITEGKTDVVLIETAWKKLYSDTEMYFKCEASGIEFEKEKREGSANNVRRTIEYLSNLSDRPIIGLFDNDRAGNEQFKGVSDKIFEKYDIKNSSRKHNNKNVWAMLLPVPEQRKLFVTDCDMLQRYFVIEHYFSDNVLRYNNMYGRNILGTSVFEVNNKKDAFANEIKGLDPMEFANFEILFKEIDKLLRNIKNAD